MESFREWRGGSKDKGYWGSDMESSALVPRAYRITVPGGPSQCCLAAEITELREGNGRE